MILTADNIKVSFKKENQQRLFGKDRQQVLKGISLSLDKGECLGIIGESGSGKSTLGRVLCGLLRPEEGDVQVYGIDLYKEEDRRKKELLKHKVSIVFQDYASSVNPRFRIKDVIGESLRVKDPGLRKKEKEERVSFLLSEVGLNDTFFRRYPHQLSGGQLQRVCIARAIALEPDILLLDEAVSSLDAATQVQVMDLLDHLRRKRNLSYLFITHDLMTVTYLCDRVLFMKDGEISAQVDSIDHLPEIDGDYAKRLLTSVLRPEEVRPPGRGTRDSSSAESGQKELELNGRMPGQRVKAG